ncbi:MAG: CBS domain-containing protein [Lentisphaeria bacterium]|nr:CBS domain-containing protein [Lentisphaeria bacterium]
MSETKNEFSDYLFANNIACGVTEPDGAKVIGMLLDMLKRHFPQLDIEEARAEIEKREKVFPCIVAPGLAVPHARIAGLEKPMIAIACSPTGITYGGKENMSTQVISLNMNVFINVMVLILSPLEDPNLHLQVMSMLAKSFSDPANIRQVAGLRTPAEVTTFFATGQIKMPEYLLAKDVMRTDFTPLHETDTIREAIDIFATTQSASLPVIDSVGDLRGVLSLKDILTYTLPEHLLWMENLSPIYRFQPFVDLLKSASDTRVSDIMQELGEPVSEDVPAIQLAKLFLAQETAQLIITDANGRLAGLVSLREFCAKFFWE